MTHSAEVDSDCRQCPPTADLSFYYFSTPPIPLVALGPAFARSCLRRTAQHAFNAGAPAAIEALNTLILLLASLHLFPRCVVWLSPAVCSPLSPVRSRSCTSQSKVTVANRCDASCCTHRLASPGPSPLAPSQLEAPHSPSVFSRRPLLAGSHAQLVCFFANYHSNHPSSSTYRLVSHWEKTGRAPLQTRPCRLPLPERLPRLLKGGRRNEGARCRRVAAPCSGWQCPRPH